MFPKHQLYYAQCAFPIRQNIPILHFFDMKLLVYETVRLTSMILQIKIFMPKGIPNQALPSFLGGPRKITS